jgi:hypothetical protein
VVQLDADPDTLTPLVAVANPTLQRISLAVQFTRAQLRPGMFYMHGIPGAWDGRLVDEAELTSMAAESCADDS